MPVALILAGRLSKGFALFNFKVSLREKHFWCYFYFCICQLFMDRRYFYICFLRICHSEFCMRMNGATPFICCCGISAEPLSKWTISFLSFSVEVLMIFIVIFM